MRTAYKTKPQLNPCTIEGCKGIEFNRTYKICYQHNQIVQYYEKQLRKNARRHSGNGDRIETHFSNVFTVRDINIVLHYDRSHNLYNNKNNDLTPLQRLWLNSMGGRSEEDVFIDENGELYIPLADGHGGTFNRYIPLDVRIKKEFRVKKSYGSTNELVLQSKR